MAKPRRPKGPRSTWEPKPALDPDVSSAPESPLEPALAVESASVAELEPIEDRSGMQGAEPVVAAESPAKAAPPPALTVESAPALPALVIDHAPPAIVVAEEGSITPTRFADGFRIAFEPERLDLAGIGAVITGYMRKEGEAAAAHMRALTDIRSPADLIRLQVGEMQRAADASLTCWSLVARKASRAFAVR